MPTVATGQYEKIVIGVSQVKTAAYARVRALQYSEVEIIGNPTFFFDPFYWRIS